MGLLGPVLTPPRWERARSVVDDHLRHDTAGLSSIALVDRLVLWGFHEEEALAVLRRLHELEHIRLVSGRWVLSDPR